MIKVLIDRNIERNAITHQSVERLKSIHWGGQNYSLSVVERQKIPLREDERFRNEQLPYLATVTELARAGDVMLFTSFELRMERIRQRAIGPGYVGLDMLDGVKVDTVRAPVDRTIAIAPFGRSSGLNKAEQENFLRSIRDSRFVAIRNVVGEAHIVDAFHLWTAEVSDLDVFLTMDKRFLNVIEQERKKIQSSVAVRSPRELCETLGKGPVSLEALAVQYPPFR